MNININSANWIWNFENKHGEINQYADFRREFEVEGLGEADLLISADTNFVAWLNGEVVGTGQFSDFPEHKTFTRLDVGDKIKAGRNVLCVRVHYCGVNHFSYIPGQPGLWFALRYGNSGLVSDAQTQCRISPAYRQGDMPRLSVQMGFTFEYNSDREDSWTSCDYQCRWPRAISVTPERATPSERPLPPLEIQPRPSFDIAAQGVLVRREYPDASVAEMMQQDFLSARHVHELFSSVLPEDILRNSPVTIEPERLDGVDGAYMVIDLLREECGFVHLELSAVPGCIIDIAVGEHLADLRVRAAVGGRNFASRYITSSEKQTFTHHFNRYAGRYLQLHFTSLNGPVQLYYAGLLPAAYPIEERGSLKTSDSIYEHIWGTSVRTLQLCMHEHYEDCPWREQALYANDSRSQALSGYYAFGEYTFPAVSFNLLGNTVGDDGFMELCAPMKFDFTIPAFSFAWFIALADHFRFSGDLKTVNQQLDRACWMMDKYLSTCDNDLYPSPQGPRYWHFYDWEAGMSGTECHPDDGGLSGIRFDAPMNFFLILALQSLAELCHAAGNPVRAKTYLGQAVKLKSAAHKMFWDKEQACYRTMAGDMAQINHYAELSQALALLCGMLPEDEALKLSEMLIGENDLVPASLSQSLYKFDALLLRREVFGQGVLDSIKNDWGRMLFDGASGFWETRKGQADFAYAGSLCHGWSAVPAYILQSLFGGIKPLEPGFASFEVNPFFNGVESFSGTIPTP